jgi:hypothetical protein
MFHRFFSNPYVHPEHRALPIADLVFGPYLERVFDFV